MRFGRNIDRCGLAAACIMPLAMLGRVAEAQNILICDERVERVIRYELDSGALIDHFVGSGLDHLDTPRDLAFGPDGSMYISTKRTGIYRYDGTTGQRLGQVVSREAGGMDGPNGIVFGPDGNLYVNSSLTNEVLRFTESGTFIDVFVEAGAGGLATPSRGILFDTDGSLLVSSLNSNSVLRFDGQSGDFIEVVIAPGEAGLDWPTGMALDQDGRLYVCSYRTGGVIVRDPDGTVRPLWPDGVPPLIDACEDITFDSDGNLLLLISAPWTSGNVFVIAPDGTLLRSVISPLQQPRGDWKPVALLVQPAEPEPCRADFDGDGQLTIFDFLEFQNEFDAGCP